MKKLFLTAVVALSTLVASAQFMVVTTYDNDLEENADKITANLGIGYLAQEPELDPDKDVLGNVEDGVRAIKDLMDEFNPIPELA